MNLLVDIGNTRLKWVLAQDLAAPLAPAEASLHGGDPAGALQDLASRLHPARPGSLWIAHVTGPEHEAALVEAAQRCFGLSPRFARSSAQLGGLTNGYDQPQRLGVDRFLAMLALRQQLQGAFCVASAGTALTFDAVDATGQHLGGVIAPGLHSMVAATLGSTRFATGAMEAVFNGALGLSTEDCVRQGALHACAGLLERLATRHAGVCVLTGGDAAVLAPMLSSGWRQEADLILQGLACYAAAANDGH